MARRISGAPAFLSWGLMLLSVLLLIITLAESRLHFAIGGGKGVAVCDAVVGVEAGDTCFGVAQTNKVTTEFFNVINPNLNCTALFVGQWLCVKGTLI